MGDLTAVFHKLISDSKDEFYLGLDEFVINPTSRLQFEELNENDLRAKVWSKIFEYLKNPEHASIHAKCCSALRILSRDKTNLEALITADRFNLILQCADLDKSEKKTTKPSLDVIIEALKVISNLIFHSTNEQITMALKTPCIPAVLERISKYDENTPHNLKIYDIRILFLTSALNVYARRFIRKDLNGDACFINMLKNIARNPVISDEDAELVCEITKVLFNLYMSLDNLSKNEIVKYTSLVDTLRELLLCKNDSKQKDVCHNIANLLTIFPNECYKSIAPPKTSKCDTMVWTYNGLDMSGVNKLLEFLDTMLDCKTDQIENICPIVTALIKIVKNERFVRKYIRMQILPPLKDVMNRPEEGQTTRAKLCKLLTTPLTVLRDIVAEFLFILCKENVGRMIKYTGYGNAAGMFANKGLLGQQRIDYSSDSEDSDTEEYLKYREKINPVIGCYEGPKSDPLAGLSEEQKEFEALKLVQHIDQLTRQGVVQPCRVGPEGKPVPIEHVLELQEELQKQQIKQDSDSD